MVYIKREGSCRHRARAEEDERAFAASRSPRSFTANFGDAHRRSRARSAGNAAPFPANETARKGPAAPAPATFGDWPEMAFGRKTGLQTEGAQGFAALTRHVARIPHLNASPFVAHPTSITTPLAPSPRPPCTAISKRRSLEGNEGPRFGQDYVRWV